MWVITGLGNPGERYRRTRHNAGFMVVDRAALRWGHGRFHTKGESLIQETSFSGRPVVLLKPQTYMNLSGSAVREVLRWHDSDETQLVVAYDDVHLPLGKLRVRERGSSGGHHGVESIIEHIGSSRFLRLRLGIADESMGLDLAEFVLQSFPASAAAMVEEMIEKGVGALESLITDGAPKTMSMFN